MTAAKRDAEAVVEHVDGIPRKDASSRDVALIHFFMLENIHWFYRISLRMNLLSKLPAFLSVYLSACLHVSNAILDDDIPNLTLPFHYFPRHFFLYCLFVPFYVCLSLCSKGFNSLPERIDPLLWVFGWSVVIGAMSFFLYWTFAWGVVNGQDSLPPWGLYFGLNMLQDIFFTVSYSLPIIYLPLSCAILSHLI